MRKGFCFLFAALAIAAFAGDADAQLLRRPLLPFRQAAPAAVVQTQAIAIAPLAVTQQPGEPIQAVRGDLDPKSFAGALQKHLGKVERKTFAERRLERILNAPDSAKRDRQLERMEKHVRVHLDLAPGAAVDWSNDVDWSTLLETILELLVKLLPLFL